LFHCDSNIISSQPQYHYQYQGTDATLTKFVSLCTCSRNRAESPRGGLMERGNIEPTSSEKINQTATAMGTNRLYNFIQHATPCTVTLFCQT